MMDFCTCHCKSPTCRCVRRCTCCPECCRCLSCQYIRFSFICKKCKERLAGHTGVSESAAAAVPIHHSEYPGVDFNRLPDVSFLSSAANSEPLGNPSVANPTALRREAISERQTSPEEELLMFPMDDVDDSPVHSEKDTYVDSEETGSSVTLEYSRGSPTETCSNLGPSSAPSRFPIEGGSNESSPCRMTVWPSIYVPNWQHQWIIINRWRMCRSAPESMAPRLLFSPVMPTEPIPPQYFSVEFCTPFQSSWAVSSAPESEVSYFLDIVESRSAEDLTSHQRERYSASITPLRVSSCPPICDANSQARASGSSVKDEQTQTCNLSPDTTKENSSLEATSRKCVQENAVISSAEQQSSRKKASRGPVGEPCSSKNGEESQSNSSTMNNGETPVISTSETLSGNGDVEVSTTAPALQHTTMTIATRSVVYSSHILALLILTYRFRNH